MLNNYLKEEAATLLCKANQFTGEPDTSDEPLCHKLGKINGISVIGLDTMLLIQENDAGKIMLTGFHGGLVGGVFLAGPPVALPLGQKLRSTRLMARRFAACYAPKVRG